MSSETADNEKPRVFLEADDHIRGQEFVCLSFLTPNRGLLRSKDLFFFSKFMEFYNMDYKIRATEGFVMDQFRGIQNTLSDIELRLRNASTDADVSTPAAVAALTRKLSEELTELRGNVAKRSAADMEAFVKANIADFKESSIVESYEKYMLVNRQRLEDEFHKQNNFQTTMHGLKVRGVYSNREQANARAKALNKKDPYFNVYVAEMGQWLPWDPEPDDVPEQEYNDDDPQGKKLNELMKAYKENADKRDEFFEEDKRQKMAAAATAAAEAKARQTEEREARIKEFQEKNATATPSILPSGEEVLDAATVSSSMFDTTGAPDLAMARKAELAAAANKIQHV